MNLYKKKYNKYKKLKSYIGFSIGYVLICVAIIDNEIIPELMQIILGIGMLLAIIYILVMLKYGLSHQKKILTNHVLMPFGKRTGNGYRYYVIRKTVLEQLYYSQTEEQYLNISALIAESWGDNF